MPYHVGAKGSYGCKGYPALKDDGTVMGCHKTAKEAAAQIYAINRSEGNMYSDKKKLIYDLNNYIDNYINNMTLYELNNVIIHYGINNAVAKYREDNEISNIDSNNFIRIIIKNLVKETYKIDRV